MKVCGFLYPSKHHFYPKKSDFHIHSLHIMASSRQHTSSNPIWYGRELCRAHNCNKRTVLVVSNGRLCWKCKIHGFSHWGDIEDEINSTNIVEERTNEDYVPQSTNNAHVEAVNMHMNVDAMLNGMRGGIQANNYTVIALLVAMNLMLLAMYLIVQIVHSFK